MIGWNRPEREPIGSMRTAGMQRSRSVGVFRSVLGDGLIPVIGMGAGAWPERPVIGLEQPFAATHAGSVELGLIGCLLPAILNRRNRPIVLKNSSWSGNRISGE